MRYLAEEQYELKMQEVVEPYIAERRETGFAKRVKGQPIYYEKYQIPEAKGTIVISHGFTESAAKYSESIYYMLQNGYNVWVQDHRGHGHSYRHVKNPLLVHVDHFRDYVLDLKYLAEKIVRPAIGKQPMYLFCHSMGGCIGAWFIEEFPFVFDKAVLSSPMMGIGKGGSDLLPLLMLSLKKLKGQKGLDEEGPKEFKTEPDFENSCGSCECRYLYYHKKRLADPKLQTCAPSSGWLRESIKATHRVTSQAQCNKIQIPVLLMSAELDTVVRNEEEVKFAERTSLCQMETISGVKHEIYMCDQEVLEVYWNRIFSFLN